MTANERKGPKQSKLSAWQSLQSTQVSAEVLNVKVEEVESEVLVTTEEIEPEVEPKVELKPLTKKVKTKTDGTEG